MTALAQVRHVLAKDLREMRWTLVGYLSIVLVATLQALSWSRPFNNTLEMAFVVVVVLGMLLVALAIQADSPTRVNAFWASQPLAPWSVLAAKLVLAIVIAIGIPTLGQLLGLAAHGVPAAFVPGLLWRSVWEYGAWLLFAMIIAAMTPDLRTFLLGVVAVPVSIVVVGVVLVVPRLERTADGAAVAVGLELSAVWNLTLVVGLIGGLALLAAVYRTRDSRRGVWALGAVCAIASLFLVQGPTNPRPVLVAYTGPMATFTLSLVDSQAPIVRPRVGLLLTITAPEHGGRLTLLGPTAVFYPRHGKRVLVPLVGQGATLQSAMFTSDGSGVGAPTAITSPTAVLDSTTKWLGAPPERPVRRQFSVELNSAQLAAIAGGVDSIGLKAEVQVETPTVLGTLPLRVGETMMRQALRIRVQSFTHGYGLVNLTTEVRSIPLDDQSPSAVLFGGNQEVEFALWNPARREAIALLARSTRGGTGWLVLPGTSIEERISDLEPAFRYSGDSVSLPDNAWFDGARLVAIAWTSRGTYSVDVRTAAPR